MRHLSAALTSVLTARAKADRKARIADYEHTRDFFEALAEAMTAERDLADYTDYESDDLDVISTKGRRVDALGRAAVALEQMPVRFAALLEVELIETRKMEEQENAL